MRGLSLWSGVVCCAASLALLTIIVSSNSVYAGKVATVSITSPSDGAVVSGSVTVSVVNSPYTLWSDVYIDGAIWKATPPSSWTWDSATVSNGSHTISAAAFSSSDKLLGRASVTITVDNQAPIATPTATPRPAPTATPVPGGTAYYVDPAGDDSNSGTSSATPWRTVARVNSANLQPGDVVYFKTGGLWRETLKPAAGGVAGAPITFAGYGTGPRPIISGSDLVSGWQLYSGAIYVAPLSTEAHNVFVDGGPGWGLTAAGSLGAMTPGSFYWESGSLYVELADKSDPAAHTVEAATRVYGYETDTGSCSAMSYIKIDGLQFERTGGYGIYFHCYAGPPYLTGIVIENNVVTQTGTGQVDEGQYYNGIMILNEPYSSANNGAAPQILNNMVSFAGGHGNDINVQGSDDAYIADNNVSEWHHNGIDVKDSIGVVERQNASHDQPNRGAGFYCEAQYKPGGSAVKFEQNFAYNVSNGIQVSVDCAGTVYNSSIYNSGVGIYFGPSALTLTAENNAMNQTLSALRSDGSGTISLENYNDFGVSPLFQIGSTIYTFAQWLGLGGHSKDLALDPLWVDPAAADFNLQSASPCINTGTYVGLPYNGSAPDMGAIESPY